LLDETEWLDNLIARGESSTLEFKATLGYRLPSGDQRTTLRDESVQAVAGFLNAYGGTLLIGVKDDGAVLGIEGDMREIGSRDGFETTLLNALGARLGKDIAPFVRISFVAHRDGTVAVVECDARFSEPVFFKGERGSELYVRFGAETTRLDAAEQKRYLASRQEKAEAREHVPMLAPDVSHEQPSILYLQWLMPVDVVGWNQRRESLRGRKLFDLLRRELSSEIRLAHYLAEEPGIDALDPDWGDMVLTAQEIAVDPPDVVFLEGGPFGGPSGWRLPIELAQELVRSGSVLIIADAQTNELSTAEKATAYGESLRRLCGVEPDVEIDGELGIGLPAYLLDEDARGRWSSSVLIDPDQMDSVSGWLRPVYEGVDALLAAGPVRLGSTFSGGTWILATGNRNSTRVLRADLPVADPTWSPFARVAQVGQGYVVVIAADVTADGLLGRAPGNGRWLMNIARFLYSEIRADRSRRRLR
jgi:hypothetical protein